MSETLTERAKVLTYLRDMAIEADEHGLRQIAATLRTAAQRIEAGDHDDEGPSCVVQTDPTKPNPWPC